MSVEIQTAFTTKVSPGPVFAKPPTTSTSPSSEGRASAAHQPAAIRRRPRGSPFMRGLLPWVAPHFSLALSSQLTYVCARPQPPPSSTYYFSSIDLQVLAKACRDYSAREAHPSVATLEPKTPAQPRPGQGEGRHITSPPAPLPAQPTCLNSHPFGHAVGVYQDNPSGTRYSRHRQCMDSLV